MRHVDLTDGNSAEFAEPGELTNGERRPIMLALERYRKQQLNPEMIRAIQQAVLDKDEERARDLAAAAQLGQVEESDTLKLGDVTITVLCRSWTLAVPVPSSEPITDEDGTLTGSHVLDRISAFDYDLLQLAAGRMIPELRWVGGPPAAPKGRSRSSQRR